MTCWWSEGERQTLHTYNTRTMTCVYYTYLYCMSFYACRSRSCRWPHPSRRPALPPWNSSWGRTGPSISWPRLCPELKVKETKQIELKFLFPTNCRRMNGDGRRPSWISIESGFASFVVIFPCFSPPTNCDLRKGEIFILFSHLLSPSPRGSSSEAAIASFRWNRRRWSSHDNSHVVMTFCKWPNSSYLDHALDFQPIHQLSLSLSLSLHPLHRWRGFDHNSHHQWLPKTLDGGNRESRFGEKKFGQFLKNWCEMLISFNFVNCENDSL